MNSLLFTCNEKHNRTMYHQLMSGYPDQLYETIIHNRLVANNSLNLSNKEKYISSLHWEGSQGDLENLKKYYMSQGLTDLDQNLVNCQTFQTHISQKYRLFYNVCIAVQEKENLFLLGSEA